MKFVCNFYIYVLIIIFTKGIWVVRCTTDFEDNELKYLSEKLDPIECIKLLDAVYQRTTAKQKSVERIHKSIRRRDLEKSWITRENCIFQLKNWHQNFPGRGNIKGREAMEDALIFLGRPDLARYIRKNRRDHFLDRFKKYGVFFENNEHDKLRRHILKNEKDSVFNKKKYIKRNGQKSFRHHQFELDEKDNNNLHPTQVIITGEISKENDSDSVEQSEIKNKVPERNYDIYWIILITVIALVIMSICATGVFVIYRKNCNRFINGRLCQEWALNQEDQKICVCCCSKRNETSRKSYSDVDIESGWSGRCSKCWLVPKGDNNEKSRSKQEMICLHKSKKLKKKKKQYRTKEKIHKKEEKKTSRNKAFEKESKCRKYNRTAITEPSHTDFEGLKNKIDCLPKNDYNCCQCSSEETECITTTRKEKKKDKSGWFSGGTSPQLKEKKRVKEPKNTEKLFQYDSGSPCSRKTCEWRKIAKEKRHGKNSV